MMGGASPRSRGPCWALWDRAFRNVLPACFVSKAHVLRMTPRAVCYAPPRLLFFTSFSNTSDSRSSTSAAISTKLSKNFPSHPSFFLCQFMSGQSLSLIGQFCHVGFDSQSLDAKHTHPSPDDIPATTVLNLSADLRPAGHQETQAIPSSSSRLACVVSTPTRVFFSCYSLPIFNRSHHTPFPFLLPIDLGACILPHQAVLQINV